MIEEDKKQDEWVCGNEAKIELAIGTQNWSDEQLRWVGLEPFGPDELLTVGFSRKQDIEHVEISGMLKGTDELISWDFFFALDRQISSWSMGYKWGYPAASSDKYKQFMPGTPKEKVMMNQALSIQ